MVGCVLDEDRYYIVGDTFGPIYEAVRMGHTGIFYQRMNEVRDDIYRGGVHWNK